VAKPQCEVFKEFEGELNSFRETLGPVYGLPRYCKSKHAVLTKMVCVRISGFSLKYFHFEPRWTSPISSLSLTRI